MHKRKSLFSMEHPWLDFPYEMGTTKRDFEDLWKYGMHGGIPHENYYTKGDQTLPFEGELSGQRLRFGDLGGAGGLGASPEGAPPLIWNAPARWQDPAEVSNWWLYHPDRNELAGHVYGDERNPEPPRVTPQYYEHPGRGPAVPEIPQEPSVLEGLKSWEEYFEGQPPDLQRVNPRIRRLQDIMLGLRP